MQSAAAARPEWSAAAQVGAAAAVTQPEAACKRIAVTEVESSVDLQEKIRSPDSRRYSCLLHNLDEKRRVDRSSYTCKRAAACHKTVLQKIRWG
jgi:hypothetical protein